MVERPVPKMLALAQVPDPGLPVWILACPDPEGTEGVGPGSSWPVRAVAALTLTEAAPLSAAGGIRGWGEGEPLYGRVPPAEAVLIANHLPLLHVADCPRTNSDPEGECVCDGYEGPGDRRDTPEGSGGICGECDLNIADDGHTPPCRYALAIQERERVQGRSITT
jgi:hypothetical protein